MAWSKCEIETPNGKSFRVLIDGVKVDPAILAPILGLESA